jgi:hypothetical protein
MLALRITGCSDPKFWYADQIGDIVPLIRESDIEYISCEPEGYTNIVRKCDAEKIELKRNIDE